MVFVLMGRLFSFPNPVNEKAARVVAGVVLLTVVVILATGGVRSFTYVDNFFGPEAEQTRRRMLIIKHAILLAAFGGGEYWAYGVTFG